MGFMESYKHLDNLCKDMNGVGVTGYINDMESESASARYVPGWKSDYEMLKHYRYIRNQIAHENYMDESNLCSSNDQVWIDEFYERLMRQEDSLAIYYKKKQNRQDTKHTREKENIYISDSTEMYEQENYSKGWIIGVVIVIAAIVVLLAIVLSWYG